MKNKVDNYLAYPANKVYREIKDDFKKSQIEKLSNWLKNIHIRLSPEELYKTKFLIFSSEEIKIIPKQINFLDNLEGLQLQNIKIDEISLDLPNLRTLSSNLNSELKKIDIKVPKLTYLDIRLSNKLEEINIHAPNLETFLFNPEGRILNLKPREEYLFDKFNINYTKISETKSKDILF